MVFVIKKAETQYNTFIIKLNKVEFYVIGLKKKKTLNSIVLCSSTSLLIYSVESSQSKESKHITILTAKLMLPD